jgi:hypothetical protein
VHIVFCGVLISLYGTRVVDHSLNHVEKRPCASLLYEIHLLKNMNIMVKSFLLKCEASL